jgi:hypothetical protein
MDSLYCHQGDAQKYTQAQARKIIFSDVKNKQSGQIYSIAGDDILPDIDIFYTFDADNNLYFDYAFTAEVGVKDIAFWENLINTLCKR